MAHVAVIDQPELNYEATLPASAWLKSLSENIESKNSETGPWERASNVVKAQDLFLSPQSGVGNLNVVTSTGSSIFWYLADVGPSHDVRGEGPFLSSSA